MTADIYDPFSLTQLIGYCGMACGILAFLQKCDTRMKITLVIGTCFLVAHFIMLGTWLAAAASGLAGTRAGLSIFKSIRKHKNIIAPFFVILTITLALITYSRPLDLLPLLAALNGTYAFFYLEGFKMRCTILIGTTLWMTHNLFALSYGPFIMEATILIANLITISRLYQKNKNTGEKEAIEG